MWSTSIETGTPLRSSLLVPGEHVEEVVDGRRRPVEARDHAFWVVGLAVESYHLSVPDHDVDADQRRAEAPDSERVRVRVESLFLPLAPRRGAVLVETVRSLGCSVGRGRPRRSHWPLGLTASGEEGDSDQHTRSGGQW
jgi:hypothetical protein